MIEDLWYKNAIVYCLDVSRFLDGNGDGEGDFVGLNRKLDYLAGLGVTCLWLQPFYPSPRRDHGYDVADYYNVDSRFGSLGDFVEFMNHAQQLGLRVILDLVVNHTSSDHPWFQEACRDRNSPFHNWYVWSDQRPSDHDDGTVFPPRQKTRWTWVPAVRRYYHHRFYDFQPDLNTSNPEVRREILRVMGFWLQLGVAGFRMDAVPYLVERKHGRAKPTRDYGLLRVMRDFMQWRCRDGVLLAEANVPPAEALQFFGEDGDRLQMILNFPVNQRLAYTLATADTRPLIKVLEQTREHPAGTQWVNFLRSHDEFNVGSLTEKQRQQVFSVFAPDPSMQLYGRGIRRRLAPMFHNDRRRLELAYSVLLTLPGTPMLQYGDELGLGDDLTRPDREAFRTPMQWSDQREGGFTTARRPVHPVLDDPIYGYKAVNVVSHRRDPSSLLLWMERAIRCRRQCPEISWGEWRVLDGGAREVLILRYDWQGSQMLVVHNFAPEPRVVELTANAAGHQQLVDLLGTSDSDAADDGRHRLTLPAYGYLWFRCGRMDGDLPAPPTDA